MQSCTAQKKRENGSAAVEFAMVLPMLCTLLFGIIEFSVLLYNKNVITNASREGARAGIIQQAPRVSQSDIINVVNHYCAANLISFGSATTPSVSVSGSCVNFGDNLTVTATYQYGFLVIPDLVASIVPTKNIAATTVMKCE